MLTDELRQRLASAAPLPRGLRPASAAELSGRWVPSHRAGAGARRSPFVQVVPDGSWNGSDGCNGQGGRWVSGAAGSFLAVAGPQTLIGCGGADVGGWLSGASRAGLAGEELVLLDRTGRELGRLRPGCACPISHDPVTSVHAGMSVRAAGQRPGDRPGRHGCRRAE